MSSISASKYSNFYFVSHCLLSVYSFVCLNLSRAHILKQSFYTSHLVPLRFSD